MSEYTEDADFNAWISHEDPEWDLTRLSNLWKAEVLAAM